MGLAAQHSQPTVWAAGNGWSAETVPLGFPLYRKIFRSSSGARVPLPVLPDAVEVSEGQG
jgi:hypothetical protein